MLTRKVLNVGGNNKDIALPIEYTEFEHLLLDIDPVGKPDIVCDARKLNGLELNEFDSIYCSHNLEHYYRHDVQKVLSGFLHVLKKGGMAYICVPNMRKVMEMVVRRKLDIDDVLYQSKAGPIMVLDVIYGYSKRIEQSGVDYYAHKTGFTEKSLKSALEKSGFSKVYIYVNKLDIKAYAFKGKPDRELCDLFKINSERTQKKVPKDS